MRSNNESSDRYRSLFFTSMSLALCGDLHDCAKTIPEKLVCDSLS